MLRRSLVYSSLCCTYVKRCASDIGGYNYPKTIDSKPNPMVWKKEENYDGPVRNAHGEDNKPGIYKEKPAPAFFEKEAEGKSHELPSQSCLPEEVIHDRSDNVKNPEFRTAQGNFEQAPSFAGGPGAMRYHGYTREPPSQSVSMEDVAFQTAMHEHHPEYEYFSVTGNRQGTSATISNWYSNMEVRSAMFSLYRAILKIIPFIKHYYYISAPLHVMKEKMRFRFTQNQHLKDIDAIKQLLFIGWLEYNECLLLRRPRATVEHYFTSSSKNALEEHYTKEEGQNNKDRAYWNGEEQRREGPYDGHWSEMGKLSEQKFVELAGRIPTSWSTTKGYFWKLIADGTNYWEKNMDYEGWYIKNVNPDERQARLDKQPAVEASYMESRVNISKNRRTYRRMVKEVEKFMDSSFEATYTRTRELRFHELVRKNYGDANRINAERTLAWMDDDFYSTKHDFYEKCLKQTMREFANPHLWTTDAFYFRLRYLLAPMEYNYARVPVGRAQEKLYNEWISDTINFAIITSNAYHNIKNNKAQNAMAKTWADFYTEFDPDVPSTRLLPWYHEAFDYDVRHYWDERCMRMKRWVQNGKIDGKRAFFDSAIAEWQQYINRTDRFLEADDAERRYSAPRMVQLYRALNRVMEVALANQVRQFAESQVTELEKCTEIEEVHKLLDEVDFSDFRFKVPVIVYPDGVTQPPLSLDGTPVKVATSEAERVQHTLVK